MDIITIIEKYIELSIRRDDLEKTINYCEKSMNYEEIEGDLAFREGNYKSEQSYNKAYRYNSVVKADAQNELDRVMQLLDVINKQYLESIKTLSVEKLKAAAVTMNVKTSDAEREKEELSTRKYYATNLCAKAIADKDSNAGQLYNKISSECYQSIEKINQTIFYYDSFIKDLNDHIIKRPLEQIFNVNVLPNNNLNWRLLFTYGSREKAADVYSAFNNEYIPELGSNSPIQKEFGDYIKPFLDQELYSKGINQISYVDVPDFLLHIIVNKLATGEKAKVRIGNCILDGIYDSDTFADAKAKLMSNSKKI